MSHAQHIRGRALTYGRDLILLQTRARMLEADGYRTDLTFDLDEALRLLQERPQYDVVVLCHTVTEADRQVLREVLEACPALTPLYALKGPESPRAFIAEVSRHSGKPPLMDQQ